MVGATATNTGNNALYLVLAAMLAVLATSGFFSKRNLEHLEVSVEPPAEIFAGRPARFALTVRNRGRLLPRWLLLLSTQRRGGSVLVPFLPRRGVARAEIETLHARRGRHRLEGVRVLSLFPLGLFQKGLRYGPDRDEVLVFPEIFDAGSPAGGEARRFGDDAGRRAGAGHDLHGLRPLRTGDDPRGIHWKQSARTGRLIFKEREADDTRRLSVALDNAVGPLLEPERAASFERLVSEAATAALDFLGRGMEVELCTRSVTVPFGRGPRQRHNVLECLALLEALPLADGPLDVRDPRAPRLWLTLDPAAGGEAAPPRSGAR